MAEQTRIADTYAELIMRGKARPLPLRILAWFVNFALKKPLGFLGFLLVVFFLTLAIFAPWIAPYDVGRIDLRNGLVGPTSAYWLGTDDVGHDVLTHLIWGARLSMSIGFGVVISSSIVALRCVTE